jgi:hypothetical protein
MTTQGNAFVRNARGSALARATAMNRAPRYIEMSALRLPGPRQSGPSAQHLPAVLLIAG